MEITWTVKHSLFVTSNEMRDMVNIARDCMRVGYDKEYAIIYAVGDYVAHQDNSIFYNITDEVISQIRDAVNKLLTE